jgi:hypothetical protein
MKQTIPIVDGRRPETAKEGIGVEHNRLAAN